VAMQIQLYEDKVLLTLSTNQGQAQIFCFQEDPKNTEEQNYHQRLAMEALKEVAKDASVAVLGAKSSWGCRLTGAQVKNLVDFVCPDGHDRDCLETEVTVQYFHERMHEETMYPEGFYCWLSEYPEEGSVLLQNTYPAISKKREERRETLEQKLLILVLEEYKHITGKMLPGSKLPATQARVKAAVSELMK
jgi:hypothetical protein